ncbi:DUF6268 family outer membrane beta-barrel protein [Roseivirga sp. 4D4]|uniref:DUF6268 family outer membrane beta-barrel protein n=1 Tax=Roseivirga sp. 4D4 TaxID=1889784 RepID=UPI001113003E|nr:DUF6268 family outer membrane beta-barrel protein [Roseivirga sp. 4D4]
MKRYIKTILLIFCCSVNAMAQGGYQRANDTIPSATVPGMPLPKGMEFNYQRLSGADLRSIPISGGFVGDEATIDGVSSFQFQLKIPIILKPKTTLLFGIDYQERRYNFEQPSQLESSLLKQIEKVTLKSREMTFYYNTALDKKHFLSARMDLALNGNLSNIDDNRFTSFIRYSVAAMYGWNPHKNLAHGVGLYLNYTLGRPSIYPVFLWNKKLNDKWGIEAKLPANFKFRRDFNDKSRLYMGYAIDGGSYVINGKFEPLSNFETAELRRSDIALEVNYERELYDFVWLKAGVGYSYNINLRVSEENSFNNDSLVKNEVDPSLLFNFSLFVVPTEGLKKLLGFNNK